MPGGMELGGVDLASEIQRVANEMFRGGPAPSPLSPLSPLSPPNAMNVGGGGASPAVMLPPIPGPMHTLPLAATPAPKDSELRAIPAQLANQLGLSPLTFVRAPEAAPEAPYFLGLAGMPGQPTAPSAPSLASASAPAFATSPAFAASPQSPQNATPFALQAHPQTSPSALPAPSADVSKTDGGLPAAFTPSYDFNPVLLPGLVPEPRRSPGIFDPYAIKRDFPILRERVHGRPLVWLDNAATTQKPQAVIDRLTYYYEHENSNVHRAAHTLAARSTDAYEGARDTVRRFLNAPSTKQIIFVRGATEAINLVAQSWGRRNVNEGDEIVITWLEHHANIVPWQQLASEKKARLRVAPVDSRGQVILEEYEKLLGPKTRLVSMTQVSNALGTIVPAKEMVAMAHRHGARVLVDGAQAVSHMPVDVQELDADFYVFSGHKVFAPTGIGVLYGKSELLETMPPWQGGGNMIADVTFEKTLYQPPPWRFEAGTGSIADAVGLGAAIDYVTAIGMENIRRYEHELLVYAEERLACVPGLTMIGTAPDKAGVLSFVLDGVRTEDVGGALDQEGIAVRSGHHCAQPILRRFGKESTVRASLAPYNTKEDIDALVAALLRLQAGRPPS
jgi:cysteine desulfurase/selenocysteine lyase